MTDWSLLGGVEPAPGDPNQLRMRLRAVDTAANDMRELSQELSRIARGATDADWRGEAADAMRTLLDTFRYDLHPIANSFEQLNDVLGRYATTVEQLQAEARQALNRAKVAESRRQVAETGRSAAAANLAAQRRSLVARQAEEITHHAVTSVTLDPATRAAEASQGDWLASQTAQAERAVADSASEIRRFEANIASAKADLQREKSSADSIHQQWEGASDTAASAVEGALASALLNLSNFQRLTTSIGQMVSDLDAFIENHIEVIYDLRELIGKIGDILGMVAVFLTVVSAIFPPAAAILMPLAAGLAIISAACAITKLLMTVFLTTRRAPEYGHEKVTIGDITGDAVSGALSVIGAGGAVKAAKAAKVAAPIAFRGIREVPKIIAGTKIGVAVQPVIEDGVGRIGAEVARYHGDKLTPRDPGAAAMLRAATIGELLAGPDRIDVTDRPEGRGFQ